MIIRAKIDVTKIDKNRQFKGNKGTYLDASLLTNRDGTDQYGNDGFIIQDVSREERAQGVKGPIIGNFKIISQDSQPQGRGQRREQPDPAAAPQTEAAPESDDVPF